MPFCVCRAISCSGASGRGVNSALHAPHNTRPTLPLLRREFLQQGGLADPRLTLTSATKSANARQSASSHSARSQETSFALKQHHATDRRRLTGPML